MWSKTTQKEIQFSADLRCAGADLEGDHLSDR